MMTVLSNCTVNWHVYKMFNHSLKRSFSTSKVLYKHHCCKVLIIGGGTGGCAVAARLSKKLSKCDIILAEPSELHYYQPMFTLVGAGIKKLRESVKPTVQVVPENVTLIKDTVLEFCPQTNGVVTSLNHTIEYEFMVISAGIALDIDKIKGLNEALKEYDNVSTIYSPNYAEKTFKCFKRFNSGNALFTHPKTPIKCAGASQKICYLAEHYFRKEDKRCDAQITYATGLPAIFHVKKYADVLDKIAKKRNISVILNTNLVEVIPDSQKAVFECVENPEEKVCLKYSFLHVTPPMTTPEPIRKCKELVNDDGFVDVDKSTLRHKKYPNIYALGDCSSLPTSRTASAISLQSHVLHANLSAAMADKDPPLSYNGYTACPILTGYGTCILAEFDYGLNPMETFPFSQDSESSFAYFLKTNVFPAIYWKLLVKGKFNGPGRARDFLRNPFSGITSKFRKKKKKIDHK